MDQVLLERFIASANYVDKEIVRLTPRRKDPQGKVKAVREFNAALGDPQGAFPSIQVAGTSGKGSVSSFLANILRSAGLETGLHTSPYLQVITEKTWISGRYCSAQEFVAALEAVRPVTEEFRRREDCPASVHGMTALATTYEVFKRRGLDVAVMETGLGGRFDLVQGIRRVLSVICDLGLDHQEHLGHTVEEIAWHKAGIMEAKVPCVAIKGAAWEVLQREADALGVNLTWLTEEDLAQGSQEANSLDLTLPRLGRILCKPGLSGAFQRRNAALAALAADVLVGEGFTLDAGAVVRGLEDTRFPGRLETVQAGPRVILDGAHNPQKLAAMAAEFAGGRRGTVLVLGVSGHRDPSPLLAGLAHAFKLVHLTAPVLYGKDCPDPEVMALQARAQGYEAYAHRSPEAALEAALEDCPKDGLLLVTGSLYLLGTLRNRWYPWQQVLDQRSSFPSR
jgi:dihydrofolate synthase/folylpolyglutamate synthase